MSLPSVLIRKSTGEILKHTPYPNEDMSEVQGLDPDLEYLLKTTPYDSPEYDSRIYELQIDEAVTTEPHPEYTHLNQYKKTYKTNKRPDLDIIRGVENAEESANQSLIDYRNDDKLFMLGIGVLIRKGEGIEPTTKEQEILDKIKEYDVKVWKNDEEKNRKKDQVNSGVEPNIDEGWERGNGGA